MHSGGSGAGALRDQQQRGRGALACKAGGAAASGAPAGTGRGLLAAPTLWADDDYRIAFFKVLPCPRTTPHNWKSCPFAHSGEAARRRSPSQHSYSPVMCDSARRGKDCPLGEACGGAHNVFEVWLHPRRYKTKLCCDMGSCHRKVCFFAHASEELRSPAPCDGSIAAESYAQPPQQPVLCGGAGYWAHQGPSHGGGGGGGGTSSGGREGMQQLDLQLAPDAPAAAQPTPQQPAVQALETLRVSAGSGSARSSGDGVEGLLWRGPQDAAAAAGHGSPLMHALAGDCGWAALAGAAQMPPQQLLPQPQPQQQLSAGMRATPLAAPDAALRALLGSTGGSGHAAAALDALLALCERHPPAPGSL
ncbi:MAG: hypothetical protein J3K34DRAFT_526627 [Monoraphidium minutum]|nr:MAG: hypothetical protein J3K34DRAFT_526627 [Monoraphidium minutum]